jgi:hypothetical protein
MLPLNIQNIVDSSAVLLDDIFSQFPGTPEDYEAAIVVSLQKAVAARNGVKAAPVKIVDDSFALGTFVAAEIGDPRINTLITDIHITEQDALAGKLIPVVGDLIADWKAIKAL